MRDNNIRENLLELLMEIFEKSDIEVDSEILKNVDFIDDLEIDSITFVTLVIEIESVFDITIPDAIMLIEKFRNFDSIIDIIQQSL